MTTEFKQKCITMVKEINEAMETLLIALSGNEAEQIEAKNVVANVLRSYKNFIGELTPEEQNEASKLFTPKIDALAQKAKALK